MSKRYSIGGNETGGDVKADAQESARLTGATGGARFTLVERSSKTRGGKKVSSKKGGGKKGSKKGGAGKKGGTKKGASKKGGAKKGASKKGGGGGSRGGK